MKEQPQIYSAQAAEKQRQAFTRLEEAVASIHDSDSFRHYLAVQARFHTYSWSNAVLIMTQRPDATRVAGFRSWQALGRRVSKGEHGIGILVPHFRKETEPETGEARQKLTGFGVGHVFDVSQTEGAPLPEVTVPVLEGQQGQALFRDLERVAEAEGVTVRTLLPRQMPSDETMGYYQPNRREIHVAEYSQRQMTKTLAHELGHHFHLTYEGAESQERAERETVAESLAFVVAAHDGLDTGERSFPYIAVWAQDQARFRAQLALIQRLSSRMIHAVENVRRGDVVATPAVPAQALQGRVGLPDRSAPRSLRPQHVRGVPSRRS